VDCASISKLQQFGDLFLEARAVTNSAFYVRIYQFNFTLIFKESIMDRNTGIIITIVTAILCGCPGLFSCFWGLIASVVSFIPGADIDIGGGFSSCGTNRLHRKIFARNFYNVA
jgi:hypothetical protein